MNKIKGKKKYISINMLIHNLAALFSFYLIKFGNKGCINTPKYPFKGI